MVWDYTKEEFDKQAKADPAWELERYLNYGYGERKLDRKLLEKYLPMINIPEQTRDFLELLLWNKKY